MNRKQFVDHIDVAVDFLQNVRQACVHDDKFPLSVDLEALSHAKNRITSAELLLKHDESNQPQPPISQTQMLGEVPQVGQSNISESSQAVEGETQLVGQNEQTKEFFSYIVCEHCLESFKSMEETKGHRCRLRKK